MPPGRVESCSARSPTSRSLPQQAAVGIPADLLRRRPDVRQAELKAAAQCAQIGFAKADLLPALTLVGNVGTLATDIGRAQLSRRLHVAEPGVLASGPPCSGTS